MTTEANSTPGAARAYGLISEVWNTKPTRYFDDDSSEAKTGKTAACIELKRTTKARFELREACMNGSSLLCRKRQPTVGISSEASFDQRI